MEQSTTELFRVIYKQALSHWPMGHKYSKTLIAVVSQFPDLRQRVCELDGGLTGGLQLFAVDLAAIVLGK